MPRSSNPITRHLTPIPPPTHPPQIIFELPDGSQVEEEFQMGQTVEVLKSYVATNVGIAMEGQQLYLNDKLLFDPLSLMDYPEIDCNEEIYVRVEGEMEEGRK